MRKFFQLSLPALALCAQAAANVNILHHLTLYGSGHEYCAWPALSRAANGDLIALFCESEEHLGPEGRILLVRSTDNGATWQTPQTIYDTIIDDREGGITALRDGRLLAHLWSTHWSEKFYNNLPVNSYEKSVLQRWIDRVNQPDYQQSGALQKAWLSISADNGKTWSKPVDGPDSVHGGAQLLDGSILVAGYRNHPQYCGIYKSDSTATSWQEIAVIHSPQPDSFYFGEPHLAQLPSGRVIMMMRATESKYNDLGKKCYLWETWSDDGGKTWVQPYRTLLWGYPPHLLVLHDGRVLCTYGYRRPPFGERACISADGITWNPEDEIILRDDAANGDLGYPASIELEHGKILTIYYQPDAMEKTQRRHPPDPNRKKPIIQGTVWMAPKVM